jgi:hypothetical protein
VSKRVPWIDRLADVAPALFGVPVLLGLLVSFFHLLGTGTPDLGWATTVNSDAEALWLGHALYQDPAAGYTGQLYTPLYPALVSLLHHVHFWPGWPVVVTLLATGALVGLASWLAYAPADRDRSTRIATGVGALGMGAIAYWVVGGLRLPLLFEGRADHLAWACALGGLVATARIGPQARTREIALAVVLLTLGVWAKQNTIGVSFVAGAWLVLGAVVGWLSVRQVATFVLGLAVVNLAVLGVLNLITDGWEYDLNFLWPTRQSTSELLMPWFKEAIRGDALGIMVLLGMVGAVAVGWGFAGRPSQLRAGTSLRVRVAATLDALPIRGRAAILLLAFGAVGTVLGVYFRRKQGTLDNQFLGVVWATGLLAAALWGIARQWRPAAVTAAGVIAVGFLLTFSLREPLSRHHVIVPSLQQDVTAWPEVDPQLLAYAKTHLVYDQLHADLNVGNRRQIATNVYNFVDLLASGEQPKALVRQLLDRHFDAVSSFDASSDTYASGYGKWEENYLWKLNQVIAARYAAKPRTPKGLLVRRPGPEADPWMRTCFGPFTAGGVSWRIGLGGGFWCQARAGGPLQMRGTPTSATQVRTQAPLHRASGQAVLTVPAPGFAVLKLAKITQKQPAPSAKWIVALAHPEKGSRLVQATVNGGAPLRLRPGIDGRVTVRLVDGAPAGGRVAGDDTIDVPIPPADDDAQLALEANQGTNLSADLSGLRLESHGDGV